MKLGWFKVNKIVFTLNIVQSHVPLPSVGFEIVSIHARFPLEIRCCYHLRIMGKDCQPIKGYLFLAYCIVCAHGKEYYRKNGCCKAGFNIKRDLVYKICSSYFSNPG